MRRVAFLFAALILCVASTFSSAQDGFFADWFNMVAATQAEQLGGGFEIAVTSFHPNNHIPILSIRFPLR
jgi:hypothetical protein